MLASVRIETSSRVRDITDQYSHEITVIGDILRSDAIIYLFYLEIGKLVNHTSLSSKIAIILFCVTPHDSAARAAPRRGR